MTVTLEPFALDLAEPLETAAGTIERREGFVVRLDVDGTEGVGEATPLAGWTESVDATRAALERVIDRDWSETDGPGEVLDASETPAAAHGVELALLDGRARSAGVPLHQLLAGDDGDDRARGIPANATVGDGDPETTAAAASDAVDAGYGAVKVKVGARSVDEDVDRIAAVRDAVGPHVEIRADANGAWSRAAAHEALVRVAEEAVSYVEQPLPAEDLAGLADLRGGTVGVAADESLRAHRPETVLESDAADVVVLKPMVLGGPAVAAALAADARDRGIQPVVTTTVDAVHARTAAVHVAATIPNPPPCGLATGTLLGEDLAPDPAPIADGSVRIPDGPGNLGDPA